MSQTNTVLQERIEFVKEKEREYEFLNKMVETYKQEAEIFSKKYNECEASVSKTIQSKDTEIEDLKNEIVLLRSFVDEISEMQNDSRYEESERFTDNVILITNNNYLHKRLQSYPNIQVLTFDDAVNKDWASNPHPVFLNVSYAGHGDWAKLEPLLKPYNYYMLPNVTNINLLIQYFKKHLSEENFHWRCLNDTECSS